MTQLVKRIPNFLIALLVSLALVYVGWVRMASFFGLAISSWIGVFLISFSLKSSTLAWPRPQSEPAGARPPAPGLGETALLALGLALITLAWSLALNDQLLWTLVAVVAAALCWRSGVDLRIETGLSRPWLAGLMLLALLAGGIFRFYRAGEVPLGMITVDEPRLMVAAEQILDGQREAFRTDGAAGNDHYWVEAAAMWLFGADIRGFRMSATVPGFMLIGLIGLLALELGGSRLGLIAAGFTAVCVWPVTFSRAEYLVCSSFMPMVAAPWLFVRGLRRGELLSLVLAGFCLGLCFAVYDPARLIPLFVGLLALFYWIQKPSWREPLRWSWLPILGGLILGLAPLLFWVAQDPAYAYKAYFGNLNAGYMAGDAVVQTPSLLAKFDLVFGRILPGLPQIFTMLTTHGGMRPWYFKLDQPVVDHATLFLILAGIAVSLIRFRQTAYAFALCWWLLGLTPTLLADPQFHMDERRIMLALPGTLLLAAIGLKGLVDLGTRSLRRKHADLVLLGVSLAFFACLSVNSWHTYFHDIQGDRLHQDYDLYNYDCMLRGIFAENRKAPVSVLSFRKPDNDSWYGSNPASDQSDHWSVLGHIPRTVACSDPSYLTGGGLFGALRGLDHSGGRDPLIVLTPFHYYLEPLLVGQLGGTQVADIAPMNTNDSIDGGVNYTDVGMAWDPHSATRLIRLKDFNPNRLAALEGRWLYPYTVESLAPPKALGTRDSLSKLWLLSPEHIRALEDYDRNPRRWRALNPATFKMADPYFWLTSGNFPGSPKPPLRLSAHWILRVPADGTYALGGSSTGYLALSVDGKRVYTYIPKDRTEYEGERAGALGEPVALKAGDHRLDVTQVFLSADGNFNNLIRLLWQRPGGDKETLPLEYLLPAP